MDTLVYSVIELNHGIDLSIDCEHYHKNKHIQSHRCYNKNFPSFQMNFYFLFATFQNPSRE